MSIPKIEYDKNCGFWRCNNIPVPNYNPDDCKLKFKKEDKMLDEDQKKIVADQLTAKKNELERKLGNFTEQSAAIGKKLYDTLYELDNVIDVLDAMNVEKNDDEE